MQILKKNKFEPEIVTTFVIEIQIDKANIHNEIKLLAFHSLYKIRKGYNIKISNNFHITEFTKPYEIYL